MLQLQNVYKKYKKQNLSFKSKYFIIYPCTKYPVDRNVNNFFLHIGKTYSEVGSVGLSGCTNTQPRSVGREV